MNDPAALSFAGPLVGAAYISQGSIELSRRASLVHALLQHKRIPERGWPEAAITSFLAELSAMDSNNFTGAVGAGEREGRVWSPLVRARHWGFAHGVGRSGDVAAPQPKAAGSSLLYALTNRLALHAARECGVLRTADALVLPLATGAALALCLGALRARRPPAARAVVWSRIDQKSCFKCILAAGLAPVVVELRLEGDELRTDVAGIRAAVAAAGGADAVVAVLSTTSCFAPRAPDRVVEVGQLCAELGVPHVVNHAYGLQAAGLCGVLNEACRGWPPPPPPRGASGGGGGGGGGAAPEGGAPTRAPPAPSRVDLWVSSTDKNFCVPVGGAVVGSPCAATLAAVSEMYPGRASLAPIADLFVTLLGMGLDGFRALLAQRRAAFSALAEALAAEAAAVGERVLRTPHNPISLAVTLGGLAAARRGGGCGEGGGEPPTEGGGGGGGGGAQQRQSQPPADPAAAAARASYVGSMLFSRAVSGTRVVTGVKAATIDGRAFRGYGAQCDAYPFAPYITAAAAMGMEVKDVAVFAERLRRTLQEFQRQEERAAKGEGRA
jgi:O-phospho-L-seryl-tRNASec:L-selenocysteinyl-tRNA synthase